MEWYEEKKFVLRLPGLEPGSNRWQRSILPLNHKRVTIILLNAFCILKTKKKMSLFIKHLLI